MKECTLAEGKVETCLEGGEEERRKGTMSCWVKKEAKRVPTEHATFAFPPGSKTYVKGPARSRATRCPLSL